MSTFFCLIIVYCSIPSLKSVVWWWELWRKDREINSDQGFVHPGIFISESPSYIISEAISFAFWYSTVAWICHECGLIYQFSEDVTYQLSQDLKSFFKLRLSLYNQWMTLSRTVLPENLNQASQQQYQLGNVIGMSENSQILLLVLLSRTELKSESVLKACTRAFKLIHNNNSSSRACWFKTKLNDYQMMELLLRERFW